MRWLDAGIIQSILTGIRFRPSFAINIADPHQDLLPLTSGLLNFLAADEVDSWRIAIAADHHPRRGARAPGRHDRVTLRYLVPSEYVAEAVRAAEETVADAGAESSHLSEDLAHAIRVRLGTRLVRADAGQRRPPPEYGDYEGVHPVQSSSGYWIGMSAGTLPVPAPVPGADVHARRAAGHWRGVHHLLALVGTQERGAGASPGVAHAARPPRGARAPRGRRTALAGLRSAARGARVGRHHDRPAG